MGYGRTLRTYTVARRPKVIVGRATLIIQLHGGVRAKNIDITITVKANVPKLNYCGSYMPPTTEA
jgi:hypothetical protein